MKPIHFDKIKYILIGLLIVYILYCNVKREDFVEHLISDISDKVDILSRNSLIWLKNKAKSLGIPKGEISVNLLPKEALSLAIIRYLPEEHYEYMLKLKTYSLDKLREIAAGYDIQDAAVLDKENLLNELDKATNLKSQFKRWSKLKIIPEEEDHMEEDQIEKDSTKLYADLSRCPQIYKKCNDDVLFNDNKYNDCLNQDNYEKCMVCFNDKISDSKYIGGGTDFECNYKDMELLCMKQNPGSCWKSKYLTCPCKTYKSDIDEYEFKRKNEHDLHQCIIRDKAHYLLSSSFKYSQ